MHLIVSFAFGAEEPCRDALQKLELPHLRQLLQRLSMDASTGGDAHSLNTPDEHALAHALGLPVADGQIPWAALHAQQHLPAWQTSSSWAFISLCHWQVLSDQIVMRHWPITDLSPEHSHALLSSMQPYFAEDGITLHPDRPGHWLAEGACLGQLLSASPERALGRGLRPWMPNGAAAPVLKRLQNEMQMLLHTHHVNEERHAQNQIIVNSFWVHGSGTLPTGFVWPADKPVVEHRLREPALAQDWTAWAQAWKAIDATAMADLCKALNQGQKVQLTLCGERRAQRWHTQAQSPWHRLRSRLFPKPVIQALESL